MNYILFDDDQRSRFLPLVFTKPVADLNMAVFSLRQRWENILQEPTSTLTEHYLQRKFPLRIEEDNMLINARILPDKDLMAEIQKLKSGQKLNGEDVHIAMRISGTDLEKALEAAEDSVKAPRLRFDRLLDLQIVKSAYHIKCLQHIWQLFTLSADIFQTDFKTSEFIDFNSRTEECTVFGKQLKVHKSAQVRASVINTETGPVVIDEGAQVMEGCLIRGPFYLGKNAVLKMGTKVYGPVSIGAESKVGGEVSASVIHNFSNKGHDGFLGNSVIGEWCNLGADTNSSNLKNDYGNVEIWDYKSEDYIETDQQFIGLIMGDHSKCGINSMFNTGTVVGVNCNVFGTGFPPKFIPSFSWGGSDGFSEFRFEKALEVAHRMMERRKQSLNGDDELILKRVSEKTAGYRQT